MRVRDAISTFRGHRVPHVNFMGRKTWWFALSGFFIALSLVGLFYRGLNFSIEFKGGALLTYKLKTAEGVAQIDRTLAKYGIREATVEVLGTNDVQIRTKSLTSLGTRADQLRQELAAAAGISVNDINEQDVGPTWGGTISRKAVNGLVIFLVIVTLYITMRFEWKMAIGALGALAHDLVITAGIYALVGRQVTPETVIAILTILGYSLYDDVVIFDKIKENTEVAATVARDTYSGVVNASLNQTLMRSVNTSLVVLFPIGALLLFGGTTLKDFAFALFIGVASGTYSSIFVAAPILAVLKEREPRYQQIRVRASARAARPSLRGVSAALPSGGSLLVSEGDGEIAPPTSWSEREADARRPASGSGARPRSGASSRKKKGGRQGKPKPRRR